MSLGSLTQVNILSFSHVCNYVALWSSFKMGSARTMCHSLFVSMRNNVLGPLSMKEIHLESWKPSSGYNLLRVCDYDLTLSVKKGLQRFDVRATEIFRLEFFTLLLIDFSKYFYFSSGGKVWMMKFASC